MAQSGYTPILIYASGTTGNTPSSSNLTSSSSGAELALNYYDGKLFYKDSGGTVQVLAGKGGTGVVAGSNTQIQFNNNGVFGASSGLTWDGTTFAASNISTGGSVTLSGGTANGVVYLNGSKVATSGSALTFDGTTLSSVGSGDRAKFGTGTRNVYIAGDGNGVSLLDGAGQTGNGWYINSASNYVAGYIGSSEQMRLTSTGLGIGTSSPAYKLDVNTGQIRAQEPATGSGDGGLIGATVSANGNAGVLFQTNAASRWNITTQGTNGANLRVYNYALGSTVATFDSSGNLGLGVTPSAWGNGVSMQGSGWSLSTLLGFDQSGFYTNARQTAYGNFATNWVYRGTASATGYAQASGAHVWLTAPSGTAGNAITFTQAMTLDASGNLGVGTTSPTYKLAVESTGQILLSLNSTNANGGYLVIQKSAVANGYIGAANPLTGGSSTDLAVRAENNLVFAIVGTERARITSGGDLLVGTTANDGWKIHANGSGDQIRWSYDRANYSEIFGFAKHNGDSGGVEIGNINSSSDRAIRFSNGTSYAGRTERARIDSSGNLLVGTTNAAENAGVGMKVLNTGGTVALVSNASDGTQQGFEMYSTTAAAYRLYINYAGTINATSTTISAISDQRLKENIRDLDFGLDKIMALKPRKFDWKAGKGKDIKGDRGWIAQEFEQVFPDLIDEWRDPAPEGEEPYKSVRADLIPVLVKAIQEQQSLITALTARVSQLESK
jgi:hypothetical protein